MKKFIVNYEKLDEAHRILNDNRNWKLNKPSDENNNNGKWNSIPNNINQYFAEPEGYSFWFNIDEKRKKGSIYNIYYKKTDNLEFSAQIITQKYSRIVYMGSLRQNKSVISKLWNACLILSNEENKKQKGFILQDLQDKERKACGNNRQRGKIALAIFKKLDYITESGKKGNSVIFKITGKYPPFTTLDSIIKDNQTVPT